MALSASAVEVFPQAESKMKLAVKFADCYSCAKQLHHPESFCAALLSFAAFHQRQGRQPAGRTFSGQGGMFDRLLFGCFCGVCFAVVFPEFSQK